MTGPAPTALAASLEQASRDKGPEWANQKLKHLVSLRSGDSITSDEIDPQGQYPVYGGNGLRGFTSAYTHDGQYALIGRQGALCGNVNRVSGRFWASEHAVVVTPRRQLSLGWLVGLLESMELGQYSVSAAQPGLSVETIANLAIGVPPLAEQRQIADYLDAQTAKIDALTGKQERLIETLAERRQAVISQQIEGQANPERLDQPGSRIKTAYAVVDTRAGSADLPLLSVSIHRGVQRRDEVTDDRPRSDDLSVYKICASGDVVVNRMRAFQGAVGIASEPGLVSPDYLVLRAVEQVDPHWLTLVMRSRWFVGLMTARLRGIGNTETGTVRTPRINATDLGEIRIALPTLEAQREIVAHLDRETSQIDTLSAKAREMIDVLKERRQALISAAVTGKIDVRGLA
ncbi:restriction endonuclease subunit S [Leifsonia sp. H3M29-4]|uniref:restriction endonuclease subunit S n=1 Tax=Salinibacterium metalliresistens TaxID=3031321 RepID=UPI0023DBB3BA|nr:restriction endonuclease subunit S [Salinibacterium metalliresistens]MDF1477649.1 restriction endonuclease subunit S [Salinibacterium metalliresistens]